MVGNWLDERTGLRAWTREWLDRPMVGGGPWSAAIGAAVATCFGVLVVTGLALMTAYAPSPQSAWASVHYIGYVVPGGWMVRGLHSWAAQALIVLAVLHVAHGAFARSYRPPREVAWWLTLVVIALALGEGITGGLLPWDQQGWWARVVEGNIIGLAPVVGGLLRQAMLGGSELGAIGLARAYTLHILVLPVALGLGLWARGKLATRPHPIAGASSVRAQLLARSIGVAALVMVALLGWTVWTRGVSLDAPADPTSDYPARPEWFLLTLFELRKFFHGPGEFWGTSLLPAAAGLYLALLPWVDSGRRRRAVVLAPVVAILGGAVVLAVLAWRTDARDPQYAKQRARVRARAAAVVKLAMGGVPPGGALDLARQDPELRGRDLFERHCAGCHVLGDHGDPEKATAAKLDGWGTPEWIMAMIHDPDAPEFFGRGPYKGEMPSVDVRPKDKPASEPWAPMAKSDAEKRAVAMFLASQGDEPGDTPRASDEATRAAGEKIVTERCSSCHLVKGLGDDEGSGLAPELSGFGSIAWTRTQVANPASLQTYRQEALDEKRKKHMPRFDADLSAADIDIVARWTRAHARGVPLR
jgi:ubiquinol-cytochrome c reductase cytochrome b subunit